jgi:hypothetical protein
MRTTLSLILAVTATTLACGRPAATSAPAESSPTAAADAAPRATADDRARIAQFALDLPALQQYYHASQPGRVPVIVATGAHVDPSWQLSKFDQPVLFVPPDQIAGRPFIEFTRLEVTGDQARVDLRYEVEGLRVWMVLVRSADGWRWSDGQLSER